MATTARSQRPRYFEGQYIGAADLMAAVDYSRELSRELALAGQTWGIFMGLELAETVAPSGDVECYVLPGIAFDGYGRAIVVLAPTAIPSGAFAGMPSGNQQVWLRYDETQTQGLRPGWETCGTSDAFARVRESFAIEVGPQPNVAQRQSGVDIAGTVEPDARLAKIAIDPAAPLVCDGSVPYQTFPADTARWLVPLGSVSWTAGSPGKFAARSDDAKKLSRSQRRYGGKVAESLFAADGVIRLRDRMTDRNDSLGVDDQCTAAAITVNDLVKVPDPKNSTLTLDRLVGSELVWVEGHMRVTGDARLWGTRLEFRAAGGGENGVPLNFRRAPSKNAKGGEDLELTVGIDGTGNSRLTAGFAAVGQPLNPRMILQDDGRLAIGQTLPVDFKGATLVAHTPDSTRVVIACAAKKIATLDFATGATLASAAQLSYDADKNLLRLFVGTDFAHAAYVTSLGQIGMRTDKPGDYNSDADDLVIAAPGDSAGLTLRSEVNHTGNIHFADGTNGSAETRAGFIRYDHAQDSLQLGTADTARMTIDAQGRAGFGTTAPAARVDVREPGSNRTLRLNGGSVQSTDGGAVNRLELQPLGGGLIVGSSLAAASRTVITSAGSLGIGTEAPVSPIHIRASDPEITLDMDSGNHQARIEFARFGGVVSSITYDDTTQQTWISNAGAQAINVRQEKVGINLNTAAPTCTLHVRSSFVGPSSQPSSHTALIENTASAGDVLALKVGSANAAMQNNFISFFDNSGVIGRIEQGSLGSYSGNGSIDPTSNGTFLRLVSGGADFAECLPRDESCAVIGPGRIVGVRSGRISLDTEGADALMVTTDRAVVVGNSPGDASVDDWEHVAMVGQVPVFVEGPVSSGDFIVPSDLGDGIGRAVHADRITDPSSVVGRAWATCGKPGRRRVTVAIGVAGATAADAASGLIADQAERIARLELQIESLHKALGTGGG